MNAIRSLLCSALLVSGAMAVGTAGAVDQNRIHNFNGPAHCQGALPNFEGQIRKRPLGIQNEGTANAFVTCGLSTQGRVTRLSIYATTHAGVAAPVSCTMVTGYQGGVNHYLPKSVVTPTDGGWINMFWDASEFPGSPTNFPSTFLGLSCNLAVGTGLNDFYLYYQEDVGQ